MEYEEPTNVWNKVFISVFIANMLMFLGQQMMNTLVAKYASHLGAAPAMIGFISSSFAYTALLFKLFAAPAIDTYNKKYVLTGALLVMAVAFLGYSMSSNTSMLLASRLLQGAGQAFTATCCLALASDALPPLKMGQGIAYFSLAQAICQSIGPTIALTLSRTIGYQATFGIGAAIMLLAACTAMQIKTKFQRTKQYRISLNNLIAVEALIPAVLAFFLAMANYNINSFLVIFAEEQGAGEHIGYFFTVYAVTMLFSRPIVGKMADKYGFVRVLLPAMGCFALAFLLISYSTNIWMFLAAGFVSAFGYGACHPAVQALCMKCVPRIKRGAGSTTNYIGQDLGNLAGPTMAGMFAGRMGYAAMWRLMMLPVFAAMMVVLLFRNRISRAGENE
ncbi:MAG: MFS transporter [Lachnospiraceae bacterium]